MLRHPQLRVRETPVNDLSAEHFFGVTVRQLLLEQRVAARQIGGRFGFIVGAGEWVVDLDHGRVLGDALASAVQDADGLDAVLTLSTEAFAMAVRGAARGQLGVTESYPGASGHVLRFLATAAR